MEPSLEFLRGKKVAIDASIFLYRFKYGTFDNQAVFLNRFIRQIINFKNHGIIPVYVFDGTPPIEKSSTLKKRSETKEKYTNIANEEECEEKTKNIMKNVINITKEDLKAVKNLFTLHEIKFFEPENTEGEKFCAYLNKLGYVDSVMSNDHDTIVFGCKQLVCTINDNSYKVYNTNEVLEGLGINIEQLVDICISSGTDYYPQGIARIGPKKSIKLCKEKGPIENWEIVISEEMNLDNIRSLFLKDPEEPNISL
jgi:flap endonuclease-1